MKIRNILILTALFLAILFLSSCNSDSSDGQGSIVINLSNAGARAAGYTVDTTGMKYTIILTGSGKKIEKSTGGNAISIPVSEGAWNIKVEAKGNRVIGRQKDEEGVNVVVTAGKPVSVDIDMTITGTRVSSWEELKADIDELNKTDGKMKNLEEIELIAEEFNVNATASTDTLTITTEKTVTLWSEKKVTIIRNGQSTKTVDSTVFTVSKGTFVLEGRNGGTITIDGNKNGIGTCVRALINVDDDKNYGSTLIMRDGVTLANNKTQFGGAVYIIGTNARFRMEGGTISGNSASDNGGGVYVKDNGHFEKKGGTIYGSDANETALKNDSKGNGDAVYVNSKPYNSTLKETDNWPMP